MNQVPVDHGSASPTDPIVRINRSQTPGRPGVTMILSRLAAAVVGGVLLVLACAPSPPDEVWVRDPDSQVSIRIAIGEASQQPLRVGRWIDLHADRSTGRWIRVRSKDLDPGVQWLAQPPPADELNVESNVRWFVEPDGAAEFNLPTEQDLLSRRVRFTAPGTYTVWAQSHTWGGETVRSNPITITVRP